MFRRTRHGSFFPSPRSRATAIALLALQESNNRHHRVLGRYLDAHMHVVRHQVSLHDSTFLLQRQGVKNFAQLPAYRTIDGLPPSLGHEYSMVLKIQDRRTVASFRHLLTFNTSTQMPTKVSASPPRWNKVNPRTLGGSRLAAILDWATELIAPSNCEL
jgi:hypothetical protein